MNLESARRVADAVLYEGYLLYPYRASSDKNRARWQFGVLGPPGAAEEGLGEPSRMAMQTVLTDVEATSRLVVRLRFLQLRRRVVEDASGEPVEQLRHAGGTALSWDEAEEQELEIVLLPGDLATARRQEILVEGAVTHEELNDDDGRRIGQVVRTRRALRATLEAAVHRDDEGGPAARLDLSVTNAHELPVADKDEAVAVSMLGAHLLVEADGGGFGSVIDPAPGTEAVTATCRQDRCWPVLAGDPDTADLLLGSPIILEDHPAVAEESAGDLFDATEIDEILTLRVLTLTDEEKAEARDTDPRARAIIDRCEQMSPEEMQRLHGVLRDPRAERGAPGPPVFAEPDVPWWDPAQDSAVDPDTDTVLIEGVPVGRGSLVRVHPQRRADAQDIFFADQVARVTAVLHDVDGGVHVALVLVDDPAADLHDWYGRYFYFSPEEVTPLGPGEARHHPPTPREESRP